MPANFPTSLDSNPSAATLAAGNLDTDPHSVLHANLGDQIEALEAKVGVDGSAVTTSHDYKLTQLAGVDALVGTATGALSGEIVVGTAPGGELGGTWASPTVDATHSGSSHASVQAAAEATAAGALSTHESDTSTHGVAVAIVGTTETQTLTNKTLTTPTVGSFTNAQHSHADAAGGGTLTNAAISDFTEAAQDAVGGILVDSSTIDLTYNDATPSITAAIVAGSVGPTQLEATPVTPGSYGSASAVPAITVDADGRITAATTNAIADSPSVLILSRAFFK